MGQSVLYTGDMGSTPIRATMQDQKRFYREIKRIIKKSGTRKMRKFLKNAITKNPETAHEAEFEFGQSSSKWLNGIDDHHTFNKID